MIDLPGGAHEIDLSDPQNANLIAKCENFIVEFKESILTSVVLKHPTFDSTDDVNMQIGYIRTQTVAGINYYMGVYVKNDLQSVLVHFRVWEQTWTQSKRPSVLSIEEMIEIAAE